MTAPPPVPHRAMLGAFVGPYAAAVIVRELGAKLEQYAASLAASPAEVNRQAAYEVRVTLAQMREAGRQIAERQRAQPSAASASGSAEAAERQSGAELQMSPPMGCTAGQVASRLRVSTRRVRQLCSAGDLEATKAGQSWWISQEALDDYLERGQSA